MKKLGQYLFLNKIPFLILLLFIVGCNSKPELVKNSNYLIPVTQNKQIDTIVMNDPINVVFKRKDLKLEINDFIDDLYMKNRIIPEVQGLSVDIMKNTNEDVAIKLIYSTPICSDYLIGITDYSYKNITIYLMSWVQSVNTDFFSIKYPVKCERLEDFTIVINDVHRIKYYEMLRNVPQKILYYQKIDGEYILTDTFMNDFDIPGMKKNKK